MRQHVTIINKQLELALLSAAAALGSFQLLSQGCGSASPRDSGGTPGGPSPWRGCWWWFPAPGDVTPGGNHSWDCHFWWHQCWEEPGRKREGR